MEKIYPSQLNGPKSLKQALNHGKLSEGVFSVKESGIDSKIFHSWKLEELLPTVPKGKWADLSFMDYLWLRTLESMRKFGCSKKLMKDVCNTLFVEAYKIDLRKITLKDYILDITNLSKMRPLTIDENELLMTCEAELNDKNKMAVTNYDINYFSQLVSKCFIDNNEVGLVIFEDGSFSTYELNSTLQDVSNPIDLSIPHLLIPISSFIKEFIADEEKELFLTSTGILNEQEYEVIRQLRNRNVKRLIVTLNKKEIQKIETEQSGLINENDIEQLKQILGLKKYGSIEIHSRDGGRLSFTKSNKIYLDKK